jgi:hypothetical protein
MRDAGREQQRVEGDTPRRIGDRQPFGGGLGACGLAVIPA